VADQGITTVEEEDQAGSSGSVRGSAGEDGAAASGVEQQAELEGQ
jgi:hypothetical protein